MRADVDRLPRLGWLQDATPLTLVRQWGDGFRLPELWAKRDDQIGALGGGTKPRKLDHLLATEPFASAPVWHSVGAIGSGHLVALSAAAEKLGRRLHAHCFWQEPSEHVLGNLGYIASHAHALHFHSTRPALVLRHPALVLGSRYAGQPVVPPGATLPAAMAGLVRAGVELAEQLRATGQPDPERLYVALGTGGTTVGLAMGLGLAGVRTTIHAVAVVEHLFSSRRRLRRLTASLRAWLVAHGVADAEQCEPVPIVIDRSQLGRGYGGPTPESLDACHMLKAAGVPLEAVYSGKAMAALLADARQGGLGRVLFWNTAHGGGLTCEPAWRERIPARLAMRLCGAGARGERQR